MEKKCSRSSYCPSSDFNIGWIQDSNSCISATFDPNNIVFDSPTLFQKNVIPIIIINQYTIQSLQLTVNISSPGLPGLLPGESYSCCLKDSQGRFPPIVVPAFEITPRTVFHCQLDERLLNYTGTSAGMWRVKAQFVFILFHCSDLYQYCKFSAKDSICHHK